MIIFVVQARKLHSLECLSTLPQQLGSQQPRRWGHATR